MNTPVVRSLFRFARYVLPWGLALGLVLVVTQSIATGAPPSAPVRAGLANWQGAAVWNFDNAADLDEWQLDDRSGDDGGTFLGYVWAEESYTHTTGAQSVWPLGNLLTATASLTYPNNLDAWMIYSFTVGLPGTTGVIPSGQWATRLTFDWWLDAAPGDELALLASTNGITFTSVWTQSGGQGGWQLDETASLTPKGYSGVYYIAFRFQSNDDGQSGVGTFIDHVRLEYNREYLVYLPIILDRYPPVPAKVALNDIANDDYDGEYQLTWNAAELAQTYVVQEDDNPDFDSPDSFEQAALTRDITGKSSGTFYQTYYYRVRGRNTLANGGDGPWSNVASATVYAMPGATILDAINNPDQSPAYTISWQPGAAAASYVLEEATTSNFTDAISYTATTLSYTVSGKEAGAYFYRVRSVNPRAASAWSNIVSTTVAVTGFHDSFDDPSSGWTVRRTSSPNLALATATYLSGTLRTGLDDKFDFALFSPMVAAPPTPYRIRMATRTINTANLTAYGIFFGGAHGTPCPVDRSVGGDPNGCLYSYYRINVIWGGFLRFGVKRIDYHEPTKGEGRGAKLVDYTDLSEYTSDNGGNAWEIRVYDDGFSIYVNDVLVGWSDDTTYIHRPYFGIFVSTDEYNHALFEHKYFDVEPLPAGSALPTHGTLAPGATNWYLPLP